MKHHVRMPLSLLSLALVLGCSSLPSDSARPLRVGLSPDRPLELVPLPFDELFDKLQAGELDIVMSGVTRTAERSQRVIFSKPYLTVALSPMVRSADADKYRKALDVKKAEVNVAAPDATTGAELSAPSAPPGRTAAVFIDDKLREDWPVQNAAWLATYLPPGNHRVLIQAEGFEDVEIKESISAGQTIWRKLTLE